MTKFMYTESTFMVFSLFNIFNLTCYYYLSMKNKIATILYWFYFCCKLTIGGSQKKNNNNNWGAKIGTHLGNIKFALIPFDYVLPAKLLVNVT